MPYAELHCRSYFSFLDGASAPEDLIEQAQEHGYRALGLTDVDGVYGAPRGHAAAKKVGLSLIIGAEVSVAETEPEARDGKAAGRVVLLAMDRGGYARLCRTISAGRLRHEKGKACATWEEVAGQTKGLVCLSGGGGGPIDGAIRRRDARAAREWAGRIKEAFGERGYLELTHHLRNGDDERLATLARVGREAGLPRVVAQDARYATAERKRIHDVLSCVRLKTTLEKAGRHLEANGERYLHEVGEIERRFAGYPDAIERTIEIADRARFSLEELRYRFPAFPVPEGETAFSYLHELVMRGARERYRPMTGRVAAQLAHELGVIERMNLAGYFLIVWDLVRFCREKAILCQGRGSAANSAVCYSIGITAVDPIGMDLLFERFLSEERAEMPDIDLDIGHQRREEVIQYVYERYGRERAAMANEVITYHARSAIRDVGKAFGLSLAQVDQAAKSLDRVISDGQIETPAWPQPQAARKTPEIAGLDLEDPTVRKVIHMTRAICGFPRHIGIHSGGMVITEGAVCEVVPVENAAMEARTVVQWDKDDLNSLGIIKIDLLGLGMLTVIDGALRLVEAHEGKRIDLAHLSPDDPKVYDMIGRADTVGVFQIESRAQMSFLPRHKPRTFYDLVIEVAIIRPGPIQGDMIHPYLRRRNGQEPVTYAHPSLEPVLQRTLGVPLFQEQGMKLAITAAGFSAGEADELRRAMGHKRSHARMAALRGRLIAGMERNGLPGEAAQKIVKQLEAFADYGFPESHAASFALIVYASAYLKRFHPAAFLAALLNAQPMGFYAPHTLVTDARRHGVRVLGVCALRSAWDATIEDGAVRLGMSSVRGAGEAVKPLFEAARARAPFRSIGDFARRGGLSRASLELLAAAGGFSAFGLSRREALWQVAALPPADTRTPLVAEAEHALPEDRRAFAPMTPREETAADFIGLGLSIDHNPVALARTRLQRAGVYTAADLVERARNGARVAVAGMAITRQRPPTAKGMVFITLEDETGLANLVITLPVFERLRQLARSELLVVAYGKVEREGLVVNLRVEDMKKLDEEDITFRPRSFH